MLMYPELGVMEHKVMLIVARTAVQVLGLLIKTVLKLLTPALRNERRSPMGKISFDKFPIGDLFKSNNMIFNSNTIIRMHNYGAILGPFIKVVHRQRLSL